MESQRRYRKIFSCEFFPPNSDAGAAKLHATRQALAEQLVPEFFSVTYGAGGTTRNRTFETVLDIQQNDSVPAAPHLTCVAATQDSLRAILNHYRSHNINRIVALRGDRPSGSGPAAPGELRYANQLVEFIRQEAGAHFHIEIAAYPEFHPQAKTPQQDLANFQRKVDAGANSAITQYFYNADSYFSFIDSCQRSGIDIPIVPGIMPIINYEQLARFSDLCGAEIPRWLRQRLAEFSADLVSLRAFGADVVSQMCQHLLDQGAPGLHFYTMNRAEATLTICKNIGVLQPQR